MWSSPLFFSCAKSNLVLNLPTQYLDSIQRLSTTSTGHDVGSAWHLLTNAVWQITTAYYHLVNPTLISWLLSILLLTLYIEPSFHQDPHLHFQYYRFIPQTNLLLILHINTSDSSNIIHNKHSPLHFYTMTHRPPPQSIPLLTAISTTYPTVSTKRNDWKSLRPILYQICQTIKTLRLGFSNNKELLAQSADRLCRYT